MADSKKNCYRGQKRKQKGFYVANKRKKHGMELLRPGVQGVLITCDGRENMCTRESYDLLNEYADKLYGKEELNNQDKESGADDSEEDIESAIAKEVKSIKEQKQRRFQAVISGANNVIFIRSSLPDNKNPVELVHHLLTDIATTGCKKTRFCMRFLPISATCYAKLDEIKKVAERLAHPYFLEDDVKPAKFCVMYKNRNNSDMHRDDVITAIAGLLLSTGKGHKVDLRNPDYTICVEIIKTVCCVSIVKDYFTLKKYNIQELVTQYSKTEHKEGNEKTPKDPQEVQGDDGTAVSVESTQADESISAISKDSESADSKVSSYQNSSTSDDTVSASDETRRVPVGIRSIKGS